MTRLGHWLLRPLPVLACLLAGGCLSFHRGAPEPGRTSLGSKPAVLPAQILDNHIVVQVKWDKYGPYNFMIDTGSSVTLVTPDLAQRYGEKDVPLPVMPQVPVQAADGSSVLLQPAVLSRIELGSARFSDVPVLVYDCGSLSTQLGIKIDGVLGFPLFRQVLLTLDYPHSQVTLASPPVLPAAGESTIGFADLDKSPVIPMRLGERRMIARIDTGSDEALSLNPHGLGARFASGPTEGPTVGTLTGDRAQRIGRLDQTLYLGGYAVPRPVVELVDEVSFIGGGILKYFAVTFDQEHDEVTFRRDATDPIAIPGRRNSGLSFDKTPAYWRVVGVIPGSPADAADVQLGDLVTQVDGDPVANWGIRRYERLMANAESVTYTFLNGNAKTDKKLRVVDVVP
ncbi:MAG TPA: aspartyl protease family protein [Opitutaceae bacterium]|nr:aspartyl protease family protein [Opitutaceae bacterium]